MLCRFPSFCGRLAVSELSELLVLLMTLHQLHPSHSIGVICTMLPCYAIPECGSRVLGLLFAGCTISGICKLCEAARSSHSPPILLRFFSSALGIKLLGELGRARDSPALIAVASVIGYLISYRIG